MPCPRNLAHALADFHARLKETVFCVDELVVVAPNVTQPIAINRLIFPGPEPVNFSTFFVNHDVATGEQLGQTLGVLSKTRPDI